MRTENRKQLLSILTAGGKVEHHEFQNTFAVFDDGNRSVSKVVSKKEYNKLLDAFNK